MDLFILIITLIILTEATILLIKNTKKPLMGSNRRKIYVDTSTLIDSRILTVAQTGFMTDELIIPRSVIRELQLLADGKDPEKRARARHGLDVVNELERVVHVDTTILPDDLDHTPVDERLIQLALKNHACILTNDFNLNKVATTEGIEVLNINDLALAFHNDYASGDIFHLKITARGNNPKQGIGHLPDGTMVVVDSASNKVGQELDVEFVRYLQTAAGHMIFAKIKTKRSPRGRGRLKSPSKDSKSSNNSTK